GMSEEGARRLAEERRERRTAKDFAAADELRDRIHELGYDVVDTAEGFELTAISRPSIRPEDVESLLDEDPTHEFSVHWIVQGWSEDVARGIEAFRRHSGDARMQHVVVDAAGSDTEWPADVEVVALERDPGWAIARNAGLHRAAGEIVIVIDGSIEPAGDILTPIREALQDRGVGICGPFGIVTDDLREFRDAEGPECDAVEGYLMAFRRDILQTAGFFDEKFKFYRTADIEYSFRVKDQGLKATVVPLPLSRHEHRMWSNTPDEERAPLAKRNFYRLLVRWRGGPGRAPR